MAPRPAPQGAGRGAGFSLAASMAAIASLCGCYTYTALYTTPEPGTRVALELNDRGRVALEQNVGPEVAVVEGTLTTATESLLVLNVAEVRGLYGSRSRWTGESVAFRPEYVRTMTERRYSGARSAVLAASVAGGFAAFVVTRSLVAGGHEGPDVPSDTTGNSAIRFMTFTRE